MTIRKVLYYPDERLRQVAEPVEEITEEIKELIEDLKETCQAYRADGLAATQIGSNKRIFVTNINGDLKVYVNPKLETEGEMVVNKEGCLSLPSVLEPISRPEEVTVTFLNEDGEEQVLNMVEYDAVAVQHENDHLDGKLMVDHMSRLQRKIALKKLQKFMKQRQVKTSAPQPSKKAAARKERKRQKKHRKRA